VFIDGHDALRCILLHRRRGDVRWDRGRDAFLGNDHWVASFDTPRARDVRIRGDRVADAFLTWRHDPRALDRPPRRARVAAGGAMLVRVTARRVRGPDARELRAWQARLEDAGDPMGRRAEALDDALTALMSAMPIGASP
jgi:starch synthase (maltosyl-transferring)